MHLKTTKVISLKGRNLKEKNHRYARNAQPPRITASCRAPSRLCLIDLCGPSASKRSHHLRGALGCYTNMGGWLILQVVHVLV